jgi:hypothetical protein
VAKKEVEPGKVLRFVSDYTKYLVTYAYILSKKKRRNGPHTYYNYQVDGFQLRLDDDSPARRLPYNDMDDSVIDMWTNDKHSAILDPGSAEIFDAIFDPDSIRSKLA